MALQYGVTVIQEEKDKDRQFPNSIFNAYETDMLDNKPTNITHEGISSLPPQVCLRIPHGFLFIQDAILRNKSHALGQMNVAHNASPSWMFVGMAVQ